MKKLLKCVWRIIRFPFVLAIWLVACNIISLVASCDWLIYPSKWNGLEKKEDVQNAG